MSFHHPSIWCLLLVVVTPLAWWRWWSARRRGAVVFSAVGAAVRAGPSWAVRTRWIVPALRTLAVLLLIVCLARPQMTDEEMRIFTEGIAIELVVDRSGSMQEQDFTINGKPATRLQVVKMVVERFIKGGEGLPGRPDDLIGLIAFGTYADSRCPLTLDHDHLVETVRRVEPAQIRSESQTAIGDAMALGVERLRGLERRASLASLHTIKSKVLVLLTDGESNAGVIDPLTAAEMAAALGIKVYTIGAGSEIDMRDLFRNPLGRQAGLDEETLQQIADLTGGRYFRATDTRSLEDIYRTIDELERTEIEHQRYREYTELAVTSTHLGRVALPPLLAIVFVLLAAETILARTRYRTLP
jgi:Ca-activated chloride channel family protein